MKEKKKAGIVALFAGSIGAHRFYLGQTGLGIAYFAIMLTIGFKIALLLGVLDAVLLFSMDQDAFDAKYNKGQQLGEQMRSQIRRTTEAPRRPSREQKRSTASPKRRTDVPSRKPSISKAKNAAFLKAGISKFKDYDYEGAIEDFEQALKHNPQHIATYFNLACAHSLMEDKDKSFYYLDRAVAMGFNDFNAIKTRDHLAYLRIQEGFDNFEANGFRLAKQMETPKEEVVDHSSNQAQSQSPDLLEQLHRLAQLKEKGLLTETEFVKQKEKLLG